MYVAGTPRRLPGLHLWARPWRRESAVALLEDISARPGALASRASIRVAREQIAINITAKTGMQSAHYVPTIERRWALEKREMPSSKPRPGANAWKAPVASWCAPSTRRTRV